MAQKKVYLVEPQDVIGVAKQFAKANGFANQIECIQGRIEDITLPERVDVIVSVFTGNFLLQEDLLPSLLYARDTYLKPDGLMIPDNAVMEAVPVSQPDFYAKQISIWSRSYFDLDCSLARKLAVNTVYFNRPALKKATYLAEQKSLLSLDFHTAQDVDCQTTVDYNNDL